MVFHYFSCNVNFPGKSEGLALKHLAIVATSIFIPLPKSIHNFSIFKIIIDFLNIELTQFNPWLILEPSIYISKSKDIVTKSFVTSVI